MLTHIHTAQDIADQAFSNSRPQLLLTDAELLGHAVEDVILGEVPQHGGDGGAIAVDRDGKSMGQCPLEHTSVRVGVSGPLARVMFCE